MNEFNTLLKEHNLKATPQRLAIIESIFKHGHINIDKLYHDIKNKFETISLATIYKNIASMTQNLLLLEVQIPNEKSVYELAKAKHSHLCCNKCGEITDVYINLNEIESIVSSDYSFSANQCDLVLSGICKNCS
jgi:Fur family peroxide stress response transcriptional regulator